MADDQEIFDQAVSENKPETSVETPTEAPTEAKEGRERDDKGRFVSKAPEASQEVIPEPQPESPTPEVSTPVEKPSEVESGARVPSWRLAEEAERRREAEQRYHDLERQIRDMQMQMAQRPPQPQVQPEPIDPFADPQGFANSIQQNTTALQQQVFERLSAMQLENSLRFARYQHGEVFDKAYEAFLDHAHKTRDAATYNRVMQAGDPGTALVDWYRDQELHKELGGSDLKTFLEKQREAWMSDPTVQAKVIEAFKASQQAQPTNTVTSVPPSLSRATAAQSAHEDTVRSGSDMYAYATAKR